MKFIKFHSIQEKPKQEVRKLLMLKEKIAQSPKIEAENHAVKRKILSRVLIMMNTLTDIMISFFNSSLLLPFFPALFDDDDDEK